MRKLIAQREILFGTRNYGVGEELPTDNTVMVEAWTEAGSAIYIEDEEVVATVKARSAVAESGLSGVSASSESENGVDLVGKVPKTSARKRKSKSESKE